MKLLFIYWSRCVLLLVVAALVVYNVSTVYRIGVSLKTIVMLKLPGELTQHRDKEEFTKKLNQYKNDQISSKKLFLINVNKVMKKDMNLHNTVKIEETKTSKTTTTTTKLTTATITTATTENNKFNENEKNATNYHRTMKITQVSQTDVDNKQRETNSNNESDITETKKIETNSETISTTPRTRKEDQFIPGAIMDKWIDTCMNITTWHNRWFPLFPNIPQQSQIVNHLSDDKIIYGSLLRRVYGYIHVNQSGLYDFQLKTHEGAEILIVDTGMTLQDFVDPGSVDEVRRWKELLYINVTLQDMEKQDIFKVYKPRIMLHYKSPIKTIDLVKDQVYHVEILQGGRFYAEYLFMWKSHHHQQHGMGHGDNFKKISSPNLFHTKATSLRRFPSLLWWKNPPQEKFSYTKEEQNRLDYHKRSVFNINKKLTTSSPTLKCPSTTWYKRNTTRLYSGRKFVDYHLVYPRNHFDYTGGWPLEHLMLSEAKAWMISNKTLDRLREMYTG